MPKRDTSTRPAIWAEGRQHPPFDLRSFLRASARIAREDASVLLTRCAWQGGDFGRAVVAGRWRIPPHRLGRTGRWLPSHHATGRALLAGAEVLGRAGRRLRPGMEVPVAPMAETAAALPVATAPVPQRPVPRRTAPAPQMSGGAGDDLEAIRSLIAAEARSPAPDTAPAPSGPRPSAAMPAERSSARPEEGWRLEWLKDAAARTLGLGLFTIALPWGAARAGLAHLNGQDLRDDPAG